MRALASAEALVTKRSKPEPSENIPKLGPLGAGLQQISHSMNHYVRLDQYLALSTRQTAVDFPSGLNSWLFSVNMDKTFSQVYTAANHGNTQ